MTNSGSLPYAFTEQGWRCYRDVGTVRNTIDVGTIRNMTDVGTIRNMTDVGAVREPPLWTVSVLFRRAVSFMPGVSCGSGGYDGRNGGTSPSFPLFEGVRFDC